MDVALPAGHDYGFETTGADIDKTWLAYGVATAYVDVTTATVHLYEGPALIGSTEPLEHEADGVAPIALLSGSWTVDWTPTEARGHTLTALAIDIAGNEHRANVSIEVGEPMPTTLTFVDGEYATAVTLAAGESVILQGTAFSGFDTNYMNIYLFGGSADGPVSTDGVVIADGMWTPDEARISPRRAASSAEPATSPSLASASRPTKKVASVAVT